MSRWSPSDWFYHAEGGKHAIFRFSRKSLAVAEISSNVDDFVGHVLRIPKNDLAFAYAVLGSACTDENVALDKETKTFLFHKIIIQPFLQCYLDLPRSVVLPVEFCAQLHHQAISSGLIPPSRLQSWRIGSSQKKINNSAINKEGIKAALLRDHTTLIKHPRFPYKPKSTSIISVEIKPKAGYITSSPLVSPKNRCKYNHTRYSLQQRLMQTGHIQKGWCRKEGKEDQNCKLDSVLQNSKEFTPSNYCPLHLFSENAAKIQTALKDLSNHMQNNFRVFYNGTQIFGEDIVPSEEHSKDILGELFLPQCKSSVNDNHETNVDVNSLLLGIIIRIVSKILHREEFLRNLRSMQLLDVIDGDGAIRVYQRFVHLCNGSNEQAEDLLDRAMLRAKDKKSTQRPKRFRQCGNNLAKSPYELPNCSSLHNLLKEIDNFRMNSDKDINISHNICLQLVEELSQEGCIYLLQNWLLSSAICDVSFFITFQCLTDIQCHIMEEIQGIDHGGIIVYDGEEEGARGTRAIIHYEVKVVDCDAKPAKKLRTREEVEGKFQFITS